MSWSFLDFTGLSRFFGRLPEKLVTTDTTQTIPGTKSFSSTILGSVSGSAASAAKDGAGNVIADTYETKEDAATHLTKSDAAGTYLSKADAASAYVQTGEVDQTVGGTKTFSKPMVGSVTGSSGSCTGNAATATKAVSADSATNASHATSADKATKAEQDGNGNNIVASYVAAGSEGSTTDIGAFMAARPSFIKSFTYNNVWTDAISMRHRNGSGDGSAYGTYIRSSNMTGISNLLWNHQTSGTWQGERTLIDSANLAGFTKSAITIYDLVPDGAASHRNFYRGKDITAAFNAGTVSTNIANGTFRDIFPGDYITKQITVPRILKADGTTEYIAQKTYTVNFVIADLDIWLNRGDTATTAHHVAIVPQSVVFNSCMNESNVTTGGYAGSFMNTNVMPAFATGLQNAFGASHLISFRIGLSNGVTTTTASASHPYWTGTSNWWGAWTSEICCLMSEGMVHGQSPNHSAAMDETMCGQFAAFRLNSNLVYNRQNYWLSDVVSSAHFARVGGDGNAGADNASGVFGVRPFALLR